MPVKFADSLYSFRSRTALVTRFVAGTPDAAALAQIQSDLASAAAADEQRRYADSIAYYREAAVLIYQYLDPQTLTATPGIYGSLSRDPRLFNPLLSVASQFMNVLGIPVPGPVRPRVAVDPAAL